LLHVNHPYTLLVARSKVLLRQHQWHAASSSLASAMRLIHATYPTLDKDARIDLREALLLHAFAAEAAGNTQGAIRSLTNYLSLLDHKAPSLEERLRILTAGGTPATDAKRFFEAHDADQNAIICGRHDHAHELTNTSHHLHNDIDQAPKNKHAKMLD
jgi:hypothetical protein